MYSLSKQHYLIGIAAVILTVGPTVAKASDPVPLNILLTRDAVQYIAANAPVPKEVQIPLVGKVEPRKHLGIPDAIKEPMAPRRFLDETNAQYAERSARSRNTPAEICELIPNLKKMNDQVAEMNATLSGFADRCSEHTGTRLCMSVQTGLFESVDTAAKSLLEDKNQLVIIPPDHYRMLTEVTVDGFGRKIAPALDPEKVSCRAIPIPLTDDKKVYVCWQKDGLPGTLKKSRNAAMAKLTEAISKAVDEAKSELDPIAKRTTKFSLSMLGNRVVAQAYKQVEERVFCPSKPQTADEPHTPRPRESAEKLKDQLATRERNAPVDPAGSSSHR